MRPLALAVALFAACSSAVVDSAGIDVICERSDGDCSAVDVQTVARVFRYQWPLDDDVLHVHIVDDASYTLSPSSVYVSTEKELLHELLHVHLWRVDGFADDAHHFDVRGSWRYQDSLLLEALEEEFAPSR